MFARGDVEAGFRQADLVIEREFNTKPVHQGYIEPQACLASYTEDGQVELWTATQGHFVVRAQCAKVLQMDVSKIRVTPTELGGGFGGKNNIYNEPLAIALSRKSHRPVKMVMTREEVFRATGPTSGANVKVKMGCTRDGRITAAEAELNFQAGAFPGSSVAMASMCTFTRYDLENVRVVGNDVTVNRPKVAAYRAPGAPIAVFGVESVIDEMAKKLGIDPIEFRLKKRRQGRHADLLRPEARADRLHRDAGGGAGRIRTTARRSDRTRAAASPPASGSTSATRPPLRSISTRTER